MNRKHSKKILLISIHFAVWMLVYLLPFLIFGKKSDTDLGMRLLDHFVVLLSLLMVFYLNFFVLIDKCFFQKQISKFLIYNLILILITSYAVHLWKEANPIESVVKHISQEVGPPTILFVLKDFMSLLFTAGLSIAVKTTGKWYELDLERQEMEKNRSEAELINLRHQINPHFLFNTLNNIYSLIEISPEKAQKVVLDLSKLLRYVLYENNDNTIDLSRELEFISNYIELMRIRFTSDVEVEVKMESVAKSHLKIAPLLFISLIENAFKHGVSPDKKSFIHIHIYMNDSKQLVCSISNSYFPKNSTDRSGSGIGLDNVKRRLEILYPGKYTLKNRIENNIYKSELVISII